MTTNSISCSRFWVVWISFDTYCAKLLDQRNHIITFCYTFDSIKTWHNFWNICNLLTELTFQRKPGLIFESENLKTPRSSKTVFFHIFQVPSCCFSVLKDNWVIHVVLMVSLLARCPAETTPMLRSYTGHLMVSQ